MHLVKLVLIVSVQLLVCNQLISQSFYFNKNLDQGRFDSNLNIVVKDSIIITTIAVETIINKENRNIIYAMDGKSGVINDSINVHLDSSIIYARNLHTINNHDVYYSIGDFLDTRNNQACVLFLEIHLENKTYDSKLHCVNGIQNLIRGSIISYQKTIVGTGVTNENGYAQFYLIEMDTLGNIIKEKNYGLPGYQDGRSVAQLPDSGYVIAGWARQSNSFFLDLMLVRTDKDGNQKWMKKYGGPRDDGGGRHVLVLKNGNILVTCSRHWEGTNKPENYAMVVSPDNGNIIWEKRYFHEHNSSFYTNAIEQDDGQIVVGGFKQIFIDSLNRVEIYSTITRMDALGNIVWERLLYYNPIRNNYLYGIAAAPDAGFWGYGTTFGTNQDGWLIKVDSLGCPFPDCDSISVSTGEISAETGVRLRSYPNPATQNAIIHYQFERQVASPMLEIFDLHGKLITRLPLNGEAPQGDVWMDLSDWVPGMFVMRIVSQGRILATGKLLKGN